MQVDAGPQLPVLLLATRQRRTAAALSPTAASAPLKNDAGRKQRRPTAEANPLSPSLSPT